MVTHPSTNRVWRSATTLIEANALPLNQTAKRTAKQSEWKQNLVLVDICFSGVDVAEFSRIWHPRKCDEIVYRRDWKIAAKTLLPGKSKCEILSQTVITGVPRRLQDYCNDHLPNHWHQQIWQYNSNINKCRKNTYLTLQLNSMTILTWHFLKWQSDLYLKISNSILPIMSSVCHVQICIRYNITRCSISWLHGTVV